MKKLIILTSTYPRWKDDKIPTFVEDLARHIRRSAVRVTIIAPHHKGADNKSMENGLAVHRFRYAWPADKQTLAYGAGAINNISKSPTYLLKLVSYIVSLAVNSLRYRIKYGKETVINGHWIVPQGFVAVLCAKLSRSKSIVTVHGSDAFALDTPLINKFKKWTLQNADHVIVNSSVTELACKNIYDREYVIAPVGVETINQATNRKPRSKYFTVGFLGRLSTEKGAIYLIKAIEKISKESDNIRLKIGGDGNLKEKLEKYVQENNLQRFVNFVGWVKNANKSSFFNSIDVLVLPSVVTKSGRREAYGIVAAESYANNTPVITTDSGGTKDIVINGTTGIIVHQRNPGELADAILSLKDNPKLLKKFTTEGNRHVLHNFSWSNTVNKYLDVMTND